MPVIQIDYDNESVSDSEAESLSKAIHEIVSDVTKIEDVPVYANHPKHKYKIAPIEIYIKLSDHKIDDLEVLSRTFKERLVDWKTQDNYPHKINLTVIPMKWNIQIGI